MIGYGASSLLSGGTYVWSVDSHKFNSAHMNAMSQHWQNEGLNTAVDLVHTRQTRLPSLPTLNYFSSHETRDAQFPWKNCTPLGLSFGCMKCGLFCTRGLETVEYMLKQKQRINKDCHVICKEHTAFDVWHLPYNVWFTLKAGSAIRKAATIRNYICSYFHLKPRWPLCIGLKLSVFSCLQCKPVDAF